MGRRRAAGALIAVALCRIHRSAAVRPLDEASTGVRMRDGVRPNISALREAMATVGLDAVVAVSPENFLYLSGALIITQKLDPARLAAVVFLRDTRRGDAVAIVHASEEALTRRDSWIGDVRTYPDGPEACLAEAGRVLEAAGLSGGRIGIEKSWLPVGYFELLQVMLPRATLAAADDALGRARVLKTTGEVAILRRAARATGDALQEAFAAARAGDSEKALANDLCAR